MERERESISWKVKEIEKGRERERESIIWKVKEMERERV